MESCDVIFCGWLPNIMFSRFIYIVASNYKYFIPFMIKYYLFHYMAMPHY